MIKPRLELRIGGPREAALDTLARHLQDHQFRTRETFADGFRARYWRWAWMLVGETANRTELEVRAHETTITVETAKNPHESAPAKRAAEGINAALAELRSRGVAVHWSPWTDEDPRIKRKQGRA
jgi:hypothetical protein